MSSPVDKAGPLKPRQVTVILPPAIFSRVDAETAQRQQTKQTFLLGLIIKGLETLAPVERDEE